MLRKKLELPYRKERCILSDVLPYEVPLTFTNRHFYDLLRNYRIEFSGDQITWLAGTDVVDATIHLLFGLPANPNRMSTVNRYVGERLTTFNCYNVYGNAEGPAPSKDLIPFGYKIDHKENEFRNLSIPHPRSQLEMVEFYDKAKELILYYCSQSSFSIRRPTKVARLTYHKDSTHYEQLANDNPFIEQHDYELEHLRSFFVYKNYSNVHKFYESDKYHRCEKKYNALLKLDISKCFDSIYTHSIAWALLGKAAVKENIRRSKETFSGRFDSLMQRLNYNETNGIIIGPEFSRLFAELLLQSVDQDVEHSLRRSPNSLQHRVDYEIFRYVDDYFVFYNDDHQKNVIVATLQHALKGYGLYLNATKATVYKKPIITEITRAKRQITNLLEQKLNYRLEELPTVDGATKSIIKGSIQIDSKTLIIEFKTIIKVCGVEYRDLLNYSLSVIEKKCDVILKNYSKATPSHRSSTQLANATIEILEFVFFIYSVSPRTNTTVRLCRILRMVCAFFKARAFSHEHKHLVFKYIFDDISFILKKNRNDEHTQVETLYLLITLTELGKEYDLDESLLASYFNIPRETGGTGFGDCSRLNFFSITVMLFYIRGKKRYNSLRSCVERSVIAKFTEKSTIRRKDAELTLLCLGIITCPHVSNATKHELLTLYEIGDGGLRARIIAHTEEEGEQWSTTWHNFNFGRELDRKRGLEVY